MLILFKPTYLYIKTHNKTGLKYFGKTIKDPFTYLGSGKYWRAHLRKHGFDITTVILGYFENESDCKTTALKFSQENNIVESREWANLIDENLGGGYNEYAVEANKKRSYNGFGEINPASFSKDRSIHKKAMISSHTKDACMRRTASSKKNKKSNEYRCWITNGKINKFILKEDVDSFIRQNPEFKRGMTQNVN